MGNDSLRLRSSCVNFWISPLSTQYQSPPPTFYFYILLILVSTVRHPVLLFPAYEILSMIKDNQLQGVQSKKYYPLDWLPNLTATIVQTPPRKCCHESQPLYLRYKSILPTSLTHIVLHNYRLLTLETWCGLRYSLKMVGSLQFWCTMHNIANNQNNCCIDPSTPHSLINIFPGLSNQLSWWKDINEKRKLFRLLHLIIL